MYYAGQALHNERYFEHNDVILRFSHQHFDLVLFGIRDRDLT